MVSAARSIGLDPTTLQRPAVPDLRRQPPFAVGVLLYEMCMRAHPVPLYGQAALHLVGPGQTFWIDSDDIVPLPSHVYPDAFCAMVGGLLQADPTVRTSLAEAHGILCDDLGLALESSPENDVRRRVG